MFTGVYMARLVPSKAHLMRLFTGVNNFVLRESYRVLGRPNKGSKHPHKIEAFLETTSHESGEIGLRVTNSVKRLDKTKNSQSTAMPPQVLLCFKDHSTLNAYCRSGTL